MIVCFEEVTLYIDSWFTGVQARSKERRTKSTYLESLVLYKRLDSCADWVTLWRNKDLSFDDPKPCRHKDCTELLTVTRSLDYSVPFYSLARGAWHGFR